MNIFNDMLFLNAQDVNAQYHVWGGNSMAFTVR